MAKRRIRCGLGGAALLSAAMLCAGTTQVCAQMVGTNLPGVSAHLAPPAGFDPLNASAVDLATHGFPPRPDAVRAPGAYHAWKRSVSVPGRRIVPDLEPTVVYHAPAQVAFAPGAETTANSTAQTSTNWSGYAIYDAAKPFAGGEAVYSEFTVPVAQQAFGQCNGSWNYGSTWVGIDGFNSSDVLQTGVEYDAYCAGSSKQTLYSMWYEWYPNGEVRINNMPISPGNVVSIQVWNAGLTTGAVYIVNYTTQQIVSLAFVAPAGTQLVGNSVEWVVERPALCNGNSCSLSNLTNFVATPMTKNWAYNYTSGSPTFYYPGANPTGTAYALTMVDNSNNPISVPVLAGTRDMWVYDEGSAY